jgi:transposase
MADMLDTLARWKMNVSGLRERMYGAPTARERERWHAIWLLVCGWSAAQVATALERDAHTIGQWVKDFSEQGPAGLAYEHSGGTPPPSMRANKRR